MTAGLIHGEAEVAYDRRLALTGLRARDDHRLGPLPRCCEVKADTQHPERLSRSWRQAGTPIGEALDFGIVPDSRKDGTAIDVRDVVHAAEPRIEAVEQVGEGDTAEQCQREGEERLLDGLRS